MSVAAQEPTVVDCVKCGDELTVRKRPMCESCIDDSLADVKSGCASCEEDAEVCESCGRGEVAARVRDYADRRKMLGLMPPEVFDAFQLCAEDLEAVHG